MLRRQLTLLAAALLLALVALPGLAEARRTHSCPRVKDIGPTGMDPADAVRIRANVNCGSARKVISHYTRQAVIHYRQRRVRVYEWSCTNSYPSIICTASRGRRITFRNDG